MADQLMRSSNELSALVPQLWSKNFYPVLLENLPFKNLVTRQYEGEIADLGDRLNITQLAQFSEASEIAEDERVDAESISATQLTLQINKLVAKDFIVTKQAQLQSIDMMNELRDLATHSIMKKMNSEIISAISPSASSPDHQISYDSGTTLALADVLEAKELLDAQDVPADNRHMVLGSAQLNDMFNISAFTDKDFISGGSPTESGDVNRPALGFTVNFTTEVGSTSYFFHESFLTLAVQQEPEVSAHDLGVDGKRGTRVNMSALFGVLQLSNTRVVQIS